VVGDRLDTDVEGANNARVPSLLVLTGVTTPADLVCAPAALRPTYLAADLGTGLLQPHPGVVQDGRAWTCGGWTVHHNAGRWNATGDGEPVDGLRALCVASWQASASADADGSQRVRDALMPLLPTIGW
jgi:hypothetical protein